MLTKWSSNNSVSTIENVVKHINISISILKWIRLNTDFNQY